MIDTPDAQCYDSPMSSVKIEKLSFLVTSVVEELHELRLENQRLNEHILELHRENQALAEKKGKALTELARLEVLERSNRKMENDNTLVRSKIQTILENLEKLNFA